MTDIAALKEVLERAQRLGTLGDRPIDEVIAHARNFVAALEGISGRVIDIGTGAGVPGLIIAYDRPDFHVVLADRRATRMDELTRAVKSLGWTNSVEVLTADLEDLGRDPRHSGSYDAVVARGFGPPENTLRCARPLLKTEGILVVSEPPEPQADRWPKTLCESLGFSEPQYLQGVGMFHVEHSPF